MRPSYIPRPKPTWLDWLALALFVIGMAIFVLLWTALDGPPGLDVR